MERKQEYIKPYKRFYGFITPDVLMGFSGLSFAAKSCYSVLCRYAGKENYCYPKQEQIAVDMGVTPQYVKTLLKELKEKGFIKIEAPTGEQRWAHFHNKYYFLNHPLFDDSDDSKPNKEVNNSIPKEVNNSIPPDDNKCLPPIYKENHIKENHNSSSKEELIKQNSFSKEFASENSSEGTPSKPILTKNTNLVPIKLQPTPKKKVLDLEEKKEAVLSLEKKSKLEMKKQCKEILAYWKELGLKVPREITSITYSHDKQRIQSLIFGKNKWGRKFSKEEIKKTINRYKQALSFDYYPVSKEYLEKLYFNNFVYDDRTKTKNPKGYISTFEDYMDEDPKLINKEYTVKLKPLNENVHSVLLTWFKHITLNGNGGSLTAKQETDIIAGANKLITQYERFLKGNNFSSSMTASPSSLAEQLCSFFEEKKRGIVKTYMFTSAEIIESDFTQYLIQRGTLKEGTRYTSYRRQGI